MEQPPGPSSSGNASRAAACGCSCVFCGSFLEFSCAIPPGGGDLAPQEHLRAARPPPRGPSPPNLQVSVPCFGTFLPRGFPPPVCRPEALVPSSPVGRIRIPEPSGPCRSSPCSAPERIRNPESTWECSCQRLSPQGGSPSEPPRVPEGLAWGHSSFWGHWGGRGGVAASWAEFGARCIPGKRGEISQGRLPAVFWGGLGQSHLSRLGLR